MVNHKKGSAFDLFSIITVLFVLAVGVLIMTFITTSITGKMKVAGGINSTPEAVKALEDVEKVTLKYDMFGVAMFLGLFLGIIITGYLIGGYAIFAFVYFIMIILAVIVSAIMANTWETISSIAIFGATLATMPMTNHILLNLPFYLAITGFVGMIAMFAKPQQ